MLFKRYNMRCFLVGILLFIIALISCPNHEPERIYYDEWYPYKPFSAGAELVYSMDITESLGKYTGEVKANQHDIAVHDDYVYIRTGYVKIRTYELIQIYDKNTPEHIRTVEIDFGSMPNWSGFYGGLVVTDDFSLILINSQTDLISWPNVNQLLDFNHPYFLFIDLNTGEYEIVDAEEALGVPLESRVKTLAGFDKENGLFWLREGLYDESLFHFYGFDRETRSFTPHGTKNGFAAGWYYSYYNAQAVAIHGSTIWSGFIGEIWDAELERRNIDNPQRRLQTIKIMHLGLHKHVQNIPARFAFDGEYIYLTVNDRFEGSDRIKLLKIKPIDDNL